MRDQKISLQRALSQNQLDEYKKVISAGFPFMELCQNAVLGSGIKLFSDDERERFRTIYKETNDISVIKFVPASGAASRMFKELYAFVEEGRISDHVAQFLEEFEEYPFFDQLYEEYSKSKEELSIQEAKRKAISFLLSKDGMNYGGCPKGMVEFHRYEDGHKRTAFEEHFHEGAMYAQKGGVVEIHFTIPEETQNDVKAHLEGLNECMNEMHNTKFKISASLQKPSTDTPALYAEDQTWVNYENGKMLFRPSGHGALLENLNDLEGDLIFIKNIDNVVPDRLKPITVEYKELLAGVLLEVQKELFRHCLNFDDGSFKREEAISFLKKWFVGDFDLCSDKQLFWMMNRPLRICGMVKNQGEPGGGPFLVKEEHGLPSLQIVESAQINPKDNAQQSILKSATHFNPVDLVISKKNYRGEPFHLLHYRNDNTGMVVDKTFQGKDIKALELPGLWNGGMHNWNTIFVEVPIETFNPVKTVFDLRRPNHC
ncbi:MAG: DUF4301 family protein [Flavobacteriales bacterium]|nr:DUF4301 family protein [Flavobacteriales bacterium]